jgi:hypothetical protein
MLLVLAEKPGTTDVPRRRLVRLLHDSFLGSSPKSLSRRQAQNLDVNYQPRQH